MIPTSPQWSKRMRSSACALVTSVVLVWVMMYIAIKFFPAPRRVS
jgi:hypothetical protein